MLQCRSAQKCVTLTLHATRQDKQVALREKVTADVRHRRHFSEVIKLYKTFLNGKRCYDFIKKILCINKK